MYCTGFHSHSASHAGSRPWGGDACLTGRSLICASSAALSLLVQAVAAASIWFEIWDLVDPDKKIDFYRQNFRKILIFKANFPPKSIFQAKISE